MAHTSRETILSRLEEVQRTVGGGGEYQPQGSELRFTVVGIGINEGREMPELVCRLPNDPYDVTYHIPFGEKWSEPEMTGAKLREIMAEAEAAVAAGDHYQHTKSGGQYEIDGIGIGVGGEAVVRYRELNHKPAIMWHRRFKGVDGWTEPTEIDGQMAPRFSRID